MKNFNIIISGTGGQGLITLTMIIAEAAIIQGYDVKTSELHGLSQRGGSVQTHIRFGQKVYSPLITFAKADLIIGLEISEALRNVSFANPKTILLANEYQLVYPVRGYKDKKEAQSPLSSNGVYPHALKADEIVKKINSLFKKKYLVPASEICEKELGKEVVSTIYLLSYASHKKIIPLKPESVLKAIIKVVPEKFLELNKKAFQLARPIVK